jgi:TRAP-type mannitol/chloroaromatic compound transport system permease large subunit
MYLGAIGPSMLQVADLPAVHLGLSILRPNGCPRTAEEARSARLEAGAARCCGAWCPSIALIFLVLGTILAGPGHADRSGRDGRRRRNGARGLNRRLTGRWWAAMTSTMRLTAMVVFILIGSTMFSWCSRAWTAESGSSIC